MLKIRLRRTGKKNQPHYRIVVAEHTAPVTGKIVAQLGHFNPRTKEIVIDKDEALRWMNQGAQASNTVARLLLKQGVAHKALVVHKFAERAPKKAVPESNSAEASLDKPAEKPAEAPAAEATETSSTAEATEDKPAEETTSESTAEEAIVETPAEKTAEVAQSDDVSAEAPTETTTEPESTKEGSVTEETPDEEAKA